MDGSFDHLVLSGQCKSQSWFHALLVQQVLTQHHRLG